MFQISRHIAALVLIPVIGVLTPIGTLSAEKSAGITEESSRQRASLWNEPRDIRSRNLFFGSGGSSHQPQGPFTFVKEDDDGTNPKFVVRDHNGVTWKVKLGQESRPETVASRFVWAMGYYTPDDYFVKTLRLDKKPHLRRGRELMHSDGSFSDVRLKRDEKDEKKLGDWKWRHNATLSPRELNGLRVMMALVNNWDLKDVNNAVFQHKNSDKHVYMVNDLGATFGTPGLSWSQAKSKGNLDSYTHSKFITKTTDAYVDFAIPSRPAWINIFAVQNFFMRLGLRSIGKHVPRDDVQWIGEKLARLSPRQIRDAFRAGGYSPQETEGFARIVEERIALLRQL
jgi:hypothetical protein